MLARLDRVIAMLVNAVSFVGAISVVLIVLHVVADVFGRIVFHFPLPGTIAFVSNFYMVAIVFLALALVERRDGHIAVDLIWILLPAPAQRLTKIVACVVAAVVYGAITLSAWDLAVARYDVGAVIEQNMTRIPVWPAYFLVPVGCFVMVLVSLLRAVQIAFDPQRDGPETGLRKSEQPGA